MPNVYVVRFVFTRSFNSDFSETNDLRLDPNAYPRDFMPPYSGFGGGGRGESKIVSPCPMKKKPRYMGTAA